MAKREPKKAGAISPSLPPLPLIPNRWKEIFGAMRLSPKQATVVDLTLRDLSDNEIAERMGIHKSTLNMHRERTGARTRMQLAMHVLEVSHRLSATAPVG